MSSKIPVLMAMLDVSQMTKEVAHASLIDDIYTSLSDIELELSRRRQDKDLVAKVESFLGEYLLSELKSSPKAVISRTIANPNKEFKYFLALTKEIRLEPLCFEYHDKFVARNPDKYHLARMYFAKTRKDGTQFLSSVRVVDFNKYEGDNFKSIVTLNGVNIVDFHHSLLFADHPFMKDNIVDITEWFNKTRTLTPNYYLYFLALFICHGVLFDNYLLENKGEFDFFMEKILPSMHEIKRIFGVNPLIYPLLPIKYEKAKDWMAYEWKLKDAVESKINGHKN